MQSRAFVLISGGIDSSTALAIASEQFKYVSGISIDYGQRHRKEIEYANTQCGIFGASHRTINVGTLLRGGMLTDPDQAIPDTTYEKLEGVSPTYVPFRNGTLLAVVAAEAQRWVDATNRTSGRQRGGGAVNYAVPSAEATVFLGAHAEDAQNWAYPDCTPEFLGAMANAIYVGTYHAVRLCAPLMWMQKHEIVKRGAELGVDFSHTWSCYAGGARHCGKCPTCYARQDAFAKANVPDPTIYAVPRRAV